MVVYQADVHVINAESRKMSYYGLTENEFKKRCSTHRSSFRNIPKRHTTLSRYAKKLKDKMTPHYVNWSIKARGHPFSSGGRACDLCLTEKLVILKADQNTMLNKRDELLETCRHRRKHSLYPYLSPLRKMNPLTPPSSNRGNLNIFFKKCFKYFQFKCKFNLICEFFQI
jgi:hypothetical protein